MMTYAVCNQYWKTYVYNYIEFMQRTNFAHCYS